MIQDNQAKLYVFSDLISIVLANNLIKWFICFNMEIA
jgi:hypothetical protein